jgi:hypothetical protein
VINFHKRYLNRWRYFHYLLLTSLVVGSKTSMNEKILIVKFVKYLIITYKPWKQCTCDIIYSVEINKLENAANQIKFIWVKLYITYTYFKSKFFVYIQINTLCVTEHKKIHAGADSLENCLSVMLQPCLFVYFLFTFALENSRGRLFICSCSLFEWKFPHQAAQASTERADMEDLDIRLEKLVMFLFHNNFLLIYDTVKRKKVAC